MTPRPPPEPIEHRAERVRALLRAASRLTDPRDPLGKRAREVLPASTGLSREGVLTALDRCLETRATPAELAAFCRAVPEAPRAHVLLSANVFVAALRAIAVGLAASSRVDVRASRREPEMARLLHDASGGAFRLVDALAPGPGDHLWAYGADATLRSLSDELPAGVVLHAHGAGFAAVVVDLRADKDRAALVQRLVRGVARDTVAFDQRGCLSPRVVLAMGNPTEIRDLGRDLAAELGREEQTIPRGALTPEEQAEITRFRDALLYAGELLPAGKGWVAVSPLDGPLVVPPVGRHLQLLPTRDACATLRPVAHDLTAVAWAGPPALEQGLRALLPRARLVEPGTLQRPPFDGPVDRRADPAGVVLA